MSVAKKWILIRPCGHASVFLTRDTLYHVHWKTLCVNYQTVINNVKNTNTATRLSSIDQKTMSMSWFSPSHLTEQLNVQFVHSTVTCIRYPLTCIYLYGTCTPLQYTLLPFSLYTASQTRKKNCKYSSEVCRYSIDFTDQ